MTQQISSQASAARPLVPTDEAARQDIRHNLDDTLFVEASAGTGKTASLVDRMVNLVASGRTTLDRIAAITFTEAAAAELRDRVRQRLEEVTADPDRSSDERERCRQGVSDLDQATVRTLHSFAAQLLHERPLDADLPPGFDTSDEILAGIKFDEEWKGWLDSVLERDSPLYDHLALAFALGVSLDNLRKLAREFHANYADLAAFEFPVPEPPGTSAAQPIMDLWHEAERLCRFSKVTTDRLYNHVQARCEPMRILEGLAPGELGYYGQLNRLPTFTTKLGRKPNWETDPSTGENACTALKDLLKELQKEVTGELELAKRRALAHILNALRGFVLTYARRRRAEGRAEFHDLLVWARDMLREKLEVRDHFRHRFTHLLIDESQDTDPIQAEIAMFLAEAVPDSSNSDSRPDSWDQVTPQAGKLFVVGDPKQSIYRFRRADVEQMQGLRQRMEQAGGRTVNLVQNFRSQEPVVSWVNHLFENWMGDGATEEEGAYIQAPYEKMHHWWNGNTNEGNGPRVWALANEESPDPIDPIRRREAADIAALLKQIVDQQWQKLDREATDSAGRETYSPVSFSDICVLIPARTSLQILERALEVANIPYRLESASLVFETQEVRDLLNCLRAIDNPADHIAVVAALRSQAFGCSDVDLLQHYEAGGRFDYLAESPGITEGVVSQGLSVLKRFHEERVWQSPAVLIEGFVRDRLLLEAATMHPRMREQWRRYRFMVERAWQFAQAGGNSLRAFVEWIEGQIQERVRVTETPVPESDEEAVRVMTIHAAKGLEFPVVILTGINSRPDNRSKDAALFDRQRKSVEVMLGSDKSAFTTPGYERVKDREGLMFSAERVRLMYVATTRARDHLVVSLRRSSNSRNRGSLAHAISEMLDDRSDLWQPIDLRGAVMLAGESADEVDADVVPDAAADHTPESRDSWEQRRRQMIEDRGRPVFTSATALAQPSVDDKPEQDGYQSDEPWRRGRAGTHVGRAVHAVLQSVDLATGEGIQNRARAQATAEGIPDEEDHIAELAHRAINSDIVRRAVASSRIWREVPVAAPVGDGFLHGFIDLLFEESDGLVIVDYKTDRVPREELQLVQDRYHLQGGAYAYAMSKASGKPVKEVLFLYLEPESEVPLDDLQQAMRAAEASALAQLGAGTG